MLGKEADDKKGGLRRRKDNRSKTVVFKSFDASKFSPPTRSPKKQKNKKDKTNQSKDDKETSKVEEDNKDNSSDPEENDKNDIKNDDFYEKLRQSPRKYSANDPKTEIKMLLGERQQGRTSTVKAMSKFYKGDSNLEVIKEQSNDKLINPSESIKTNNDKYDTDNFNKGKEELVNNNIRSLINKTKSKSKNEINFNEENKNGLEPISYNNSGKQQHHFFIFTLLF